MKTIRTEEMTWREIEQAIKNGYTTLFVAVGSIEQHGPHLPTITDSIIGDYLSNKIAKKLGKALQGPTIRFGCSEHHLNFPGTITLENETFKSVIRDYTTSTLKAGFKTIFFIPSHGGNFEPLKDTIEELQEIHPSVIIDGYTNLLEYMNQFIKYSSELKISKEEAGVHAGESETSMMLLIAEELVKSDKFRPGYLGAFGKAEIENVIDSGLDSITKSGVLGDPSKASKQNGKLYLEKMVDFIINKIENRLK